MARKQPNKQRIAEAIAQGGKIHGDSYRAEYETGWTVAWKRVRYNESGWVSWPGGRGAAYDRLNEPERNVFFAGHHLSYEIAWQAEAIYSARKAVSALASRLASATSHRRTARHALRWRRPR